MCYEGKCLCLEVETGALIYAIPNVILTSLGTIASIGGLIYFNVFAKSYVERANEEGNAEKAAEIAGAAVVGNLSLSISAVVLIVALVFAIVLLAGICKRNPHHVKAYFIYGVMNMCLAAILVLYILIVLPFGAALIALIPFLIQGSILHMIRLTYLKFQAESTYQAFSNPMPLDDKIC